MKRYRKLSIIIAVCFVVAVVTVEFGFRHLVVDGPESEILRKRLVELPEVRTYFGDIASIELSRAGTKWSSGTDGKKGTYNYFVRGSRVSGTVMTKWEQKPRADPVIREIRRAHIEGGEILFRR
jgi:hypothetical protein